MSSTPTLSNDDKSPDVHGAHRHHSPDVRDAHRHHSHPLHEQQSKTLVAPDGRKYHVAPCPRTAHTLRKELEELHPDGHFDCVVHGSPEHIEALRKLHSHHQQRRNTLRDKLGGTYDECESIHRELDHLSTELHRLTEHDVALDATFSKYGYGAHLRTYDQNLQPSCSMDPSEDSGKPHCPNHSDSAVREDSSSPKFYRQPVIRQYFHKGLLWRASGLEEVGPFELFVDLLYVDDIVQRIFILLTVACLFGFSTNMLMAFAGRTWPQLIGFYLAARVLFALYCLLQAYFVPTVRGMMLSSALTVVTPFALWVASIYVELPRRLILIWIAMLLDSFGLTWTIFLQRDAGRVSKRLEAWYDRHYELYPAINIEHKSERTKQFVTLVLGYAVVGLLYQSSASFGINAFFGKAILGLVQGFAINWIYFEIDGKNIHVHAIRRHVGTSLFWLSVHLPFVMALALAGAALSRLVVAHDCANARVSDLSDLITDYKERSVGEIEDGLRWFYCAGLGVSTLTMAGISASHIHKEFLIPRIEKAYRFLYRLAVGFVFIGLGFARQLNSLQLIGTTTALVVSVLAVDIYGSSNSQTSFFGASNDAVMAMNYIARAQASKEDVRNALVTDKVLDVEKLATMADTGPSGPSGPTIYRATIKEEPKDTTDGDNGRTRPRRHSLFRPSSFSTKEDLLEQMYGLR